MVILNQSPVATGSAFVPSAPVRQLGLEFRPETAEDVPFLRRLYVSMRWYELAGVDWSDQDKVAFLVQQFEFQHRHYSKYYHDAAFLIISRGGEDIGRLYLYRNQRDIRVVDIGFLPEHRSRGLGTAILETLFAEAGATDRTVSVHVEVFNPAKALYERLGFIKAGEEGPYHLMVWTPPARSPG